MTLNARIWNVVVPGAWNPAILTPDGIASRVLQLPAGSPIGVEIAFGLDAPPRVTHENLTVQVTSSRLEVHARAMEPATLDEAKAAARHVIENLDATPLSGAGVNFDFQLTEPPPDFLTLMSTNLDAELAGEDFTVRRRGARTTISHDIGVLNLNIEQEAEDVWGIKFNFHMPSRERPEILAWLERDAQTFNNVVEKILNRVLKLEDVDREAPEVEHDT